MARLKEAVDGRALAEQPDARFEALPSQRLRGEAKLLLRIQEVGIWGS